MIKPCTLLNKMLTATSLSARVAKLDALTGLCLLVVMLIACDSSVQTNGDKAEIRS